MNDAHEAKIARLFDAMAEEYDELEDVWYPHLFAQIERFIRAQVAPDEGACLDVGCGTGLQTLLYAELGYQVVGLDISRGLIAKAQAKAAAAGVRPAPRFVQATAQRMPFGDGWFDVVNCCGSTLSFIDDYRGAVAEMARVLRPGGLLVLEVEQKWNLDLVWPLLDAASRGRLGYEQPVAKTLDNLLRPLGEGMSVDYPFVHNDGATEVMPIRCFTAAEVESALRAAGLGVRKTWAIHSVSNLLPSTLLGDPQASETVKRLGRWLTRLDRAVAGWPGFRGLGCSLVLSAVKAR